MPKKILVTGGAGFIGYHLGKSLAGEGHEVNLCDNLFRGKMDGELQKLREQSNVSFFTCDLTQREELDKLEKDYDQVYHLAAINGTRYFYEVPETVLRVNVLALVNLLDWFVENCSGKILFASSSEVYAGTARAFGVPIPTPEDVSLVIDDVQNPRLSYAGSKIIGELFSINYQRAYKFPMTIIRYHNIYGPRMGYEHVIPEFCLRILSKEGPFRIYGGSESRAFCYIDDAIRATKLAMDSTSTNNEIVHIGNPNEEITITELANKMFGLFNFYPSVEILPAPQGSVNRRCPDITKLTRLTGYRPETDLAEGLKKTFDWYKDAAAQ